jgi:hypothetical protein
VFYFPKTAEGEQPTVITHTIGIGKVGWSTPEGSTKVTGKTKNPTWYPPASVRKEHAEAGDRLPGKVPPGPDNPLGAHMMTLGWPSYLIHGTNKPYGVGLRSSHGCIRFYPEDIAELYADIPVGTKVTVVNQPFVFGWQGDAMYAQAFPIMEDDKREHPKAADALLNAAISDEMWQKVKQHGAAVDLELVNAMVSKPRGIAIPVSKRKLTVDSFIFASRHVENRLPEGSNWDGSEQTMYTAEDFEAARAGTPQPLKKTVPAKPAVKKATGQTSNVAATSSAATAKAPVTAAKASSSTAAKTPTAATKVPTAATAKASATTTKASAATAKAAAAKSTTTTAATAAAPKKAPAAQSSTAKTAPPAATTKTAPAAAAKAAPATTTKPVASAVVAPTAAVAGSR